MAPWLGGHLSESETESESESETESETESESESEAHGEQARGAAIRRATLKYPHFF